MKHPSILRLLATLLLALTATAVSAFEVNGINYSINDDNASVKVTANYMNPYTGSVSIPSSVSYEGKSYNVTAIAAMAFYNCSELTSVSLPSSLKEIGMSAFSTCTKLSSITIPNSVTSIGFYAFQNCSALSKVSIGSSVTDIGMNAFENCTGLTSITIPNSVVTLYQQAFYNCTSLTTVKISDSIETIFYGTFQGCEKLTTVTFGKSITQIQTSAFEGCKNIKSVALPTTLLRIEYQAFKGCSGLTSITIPDATYDIGSYAFANCTGLKTITLGTAVNLLGEGTFSQCANVDHIYCNSETPPVCCQGALDGISRNNCKVQVPGKALEAYQRADTWKEFTNLYGGSADFEVDNDVITVENGCILTGGKALRIYNLQGVEIYSGHEAQVHLPAGIYIIHNPATGRTTKLTLH